MADPVTEQRESPRLVLRLNVEFLSEAERGEAPQMGTTANVSSGGVYFLTDEWRQLQIGQELGIRLSGLSGYGGVPLFRSLRAKATVLRLDKPRESDAPYAKAGIAAQFSERPYFELYRWLG